MCTYNLYKCNDSTCNHMWAVIQIPCCPNAGFTNCSRFTTKRKHFNWPSGSNFREGKKEDCPWHSLKGNYDFNVIRMVETRLKFWPPSLCGMAPREEVDGLRFLVCKVM